MVVLLAGAGNFTPLGLQEFTLTLLGGPNQGDLTQTLALNISPDFQVGSAASGSFGIEYFAIYFGSLIMRVGETSSVPVKLLVWLVKHLENNGVGRLVAVGGKLFPKGQELRLVGLGVLAHAAKLVEIQDDLQALRGGLSHRPVQRLQPRRAQGPAVGPVHVAEGMQADPPRPEHPRPDFQREAWLNLNGEWQFEVDVQGEGEQRGWILGSQPRAKDHRALLPGEQALRYYWILKYRRTTVV